jgi:hypothetical protein
MMSNNTKRPKRILLHDGEWWAEETSKGMVRLIGDEAPAWFDKAEIRILIPGSLDPAPSGLEIDIGIDD